MTANKSTIIKRLEEDKKKQSISRLKLQIKPIKSISQMENQLPIDLMCFVKSSILKHINLKKGKAKRKKEIQIFDNSETIIQIEIWGDSAENYNYKENDILVIKNALVNSYNQCKYLYLSIATNIVLNPANVDEFEGLRELI